MPQRPTHIVRIIVNSDHGGVRPYPIHGFEDYHFDTRLILDCMDFSKYNASGDKGIFSPISALRC